MFTGIVQGTAPVVAIEDLDGLRRLSIALPDTQGLLRGASVCINGVCLTAVGIAEKVDFDVIGETLDKTTLGDLAVGDAVNWERSATLGKEIGGHLVSGHVSGVATIIDRVDAANNRQLVFQLPDGMVDYVLAKGFVSLHGCSLTVGEVDDAAGTFDVHLIPETLDVTVLGQMNRGDRVNVELDPMTQAVVETVRRVMARRG